MLSSLLPESYVWTGHQLRPAGDPAVRHWLRQVPVIRISDFFAEDLAEYLPVPDWHIQILARAEPEVY